MDSVNGVSWAIAVAMGLTGLVGGLVWGRLRSSARHRHRTGKLMALRAELEQHQLRASTLEADLHAQRARSFALEREMESRESDWAQSSPTPFSFDAQTFQIDRSARADTRPWPQNAAHDAGLELQIRELEDPRSKAPLQARPPGARSVHPSRKMPERRQMVAPAWIELDAANSAHGTLQTSMDQGRQAPPPRRTGNRRPADSPAPQRGSNRGTGQPETRDSAAGEIEGLARRAEALRNGPLPVERGQPTELETGVSPSRPDDLKLIAGIDASVETVLNAAGYRSFRDIAAAKPEELAWALAAADLPLSHALTVVWHKQAALLADRRTSAFRTVPSNHDEGTQAASL